MATSNVSRIYRGETGSGVFLPPPSWIGLRTHSDGYIKGDKYPFFIQANKYLFFIKVDAANVLLKLKCLESIVDAIRKDHVYPTKQYKHSIERSSVTY